MAKYFPNDYQYVPKEFLVPEQLEELKEEIDDD